MLLHHARCGRSAHHTPLLLLTLALLHGIVTFVDRVLCAVHGHAMVLRYEPGRLSLRCLHCGARTTGWIIREASHDNRETLRQKSRDAGVLRSHVHDRLVWFDESGHEPFIDEPSKFNAAMVERVRPAVSLALAGRVGHSASRHPPSAAGTPPAASPAV